MKSFPKFFFSVENKFTGKYVLHQIYLFILIFEGGTEVGWTPLSSVILWRRMLGIMGNINHIKDPEIHATVFKHLIELWQMLANVSHLSLLIGTPTLKEMNKLPFEHFALAFVEIGRYRFFALPF